MEARTRILDAARALFTRDSGYEKATIRQIAERADVSVGAVYLHFTSKPEILAVLVNEFMREAMGGLSDLLSRAMSGLDKFKIFMSRLEQFFSDRSSQLFIQLLVRLGPQNLDKKVVDTIAPYIHRYIEELTDIIAQGVKDGSFPYVGRKPRLIAVVLFHCLESVASISFGSRKFRENISAGFTAPEIFSGFMSLMLDALSRIPRSSHEA
jgi:AcrR family transcriptional regulator